MDDKIHIVTSKDASKIAKILGNKTAQKIIDHIRDNKGITATKLSTDLKLPASTIHYNLKALCESGIIDDTNFHYSEKGKAVPNYELTNRIIILAPSQKEPIKESLQALLPGISLVALLGAGYILAKKIIYNKATQQVAPLAARSAPLAANNADIAIAPTTESFKQVATAPSTQTAIHSATTDPSFILGLVVATVIIVATFFLVRYLKKK